MESNGNIYEAIVNVMSEIGAIGKDKKNVQQGFMYRGVDDVVNAIQPALVRNNMFIVPEILDQSREERTSRNGATLIYSVCRIKYTFFAKDGSNVTAITIGEGMDSGDKATNKAMAIAFKYACFQVFCIPTEEMKDPDSESHEVRPASPLPATSPFIQSSPAAPPASQSDSAGAGLISKAQAKRMYALSNANADLCKEILSKFGYDKSDNVRKSDYEAICVEIQNRAA